MNKPHTKETKRKISLALKGRKVWNKGKKFSLESRRKMGAAHKGFKHSEETKENLSKIAKEKNFGKWTIGKKHSEETKRKIGNAHKGMKRSIETRQKMSLAHMGKPGHPISQETKRKMREAYKRRVEVLGKHWNWKNGKYKQHGYILIHCPSHPFCSQRGYVREHRLVIEKQIERFLKPEESAHHINKTRDDNRPENLMAFCSNSAHISFEKWNKIDPSDIIFDGRTL